MTLCSWQAAARPGRHDFRADVTNNGTLDVRNEFRQLLKLVRRHLRRRGDINFHRQSDVEAARTHLAVLLPLSAAHSNWQIRWRCKNSTLDYEQRQPDLQRHHISHTGGLSGGTNLNLVNADIRGGGLDSRWQQLKTQSSRGAFSGGGSFD